MNSDRAKQIFLAALDLPEAARPAYLAQACGAENELRREVERLLAAHASSSVLDVDATVAGVPLTEGPGTRIGPYKLLQKLGEGGFGVVFMADQDSPVRRRVALKIIKLGMDTKLVIARFEAERQALALMDHPNIARVLDGGATDAGRPYFVMEYVKGEPVTQYADRNNLSIPDRLGLFTQVCHAIQHAHLKGIIHRDIKPSNVIVSTQDGRPHAKVIDFGIAKATDHRLTEKTLFTEHHLLIGTPAYMSPEQAEGSLDIDTRTDVYSLGVLLYELLTGSTPFDNTKLREAAYAEIQRIIREVDPPKPSTRLSESGDMLTALAARRRVEAKKFGSTVRGELDWIVMKALDKDRARRYESATAFAEDVRRHLAGEPIIAAPPSAAYRAKKFVTVHRWGVASSVMFTVAIVSLVLTIIASQKARIANKQLKLEQTQRQRIEAASLTEQAILLFRLGDSQKANELLGESVKFNREDFRVLINTANAYVSRFRDTHKSRDAEEAISLLDQAVTIDPNRPEPYNFRAIILREQGKFEEAISTLRNGIALDRNYYPNHVTLSTTLLRLGRWSEARQALVDSTSLSLTDGDDRPWLRWHNLAAIDLALGNPRAEQDIKNALKEKGGRANPNVRLLEARIAIASKDPAVADRALHLALLADDLANGPEWEKFGGPPKGLTRRILAQAYLKKENWAKAAESADEAIGSKDTCPAIPNLIAAVAYKRLNRQDLADASRKAVPCDCLTKLEKDPQGLTAEIPNGVAWIESLEECRKLEMQADIPLEQRH
ncbi:MAG: protein kinase [Planctomycetes bacterium]|nr:protein kinase [Planctomycetota bacterium]